ncbi:MAG: TAXI family TRAP transporter solute-binding subunit [Deltaproteobacteria bacterium]|nr:TAXI family TRAP transporter solute-binding subunit [Deltaproteobacteria bacterium]
MKKAWIGILATGWVLAFSVPASAAEVQPKTVGIGTHPMGSMFNIIGTAAATVVAKNTAIRTTVKPMVGPVGWYPLLETAEIDLGVVNNWDAEKGYLGQSTYQRLSEGKGFPLRLVAVTIPNSISLVVSANSGITKIAELKGKRVAGNFPTPSLQAQTEAILANGGLSFGDVKIVSVDSPPGGVKAVIEGRADASGTATIGMPVIEELNARKGARFLPLEPARDAVKRTNTRYPGYPVKVTPGPGKTGVDKEMYLWGYDIYLVGRAGLAEDSVYQMVKALWENYKELGPVHPLLKEWTPERFVSKEARIPYHPGAIKFYRERGAWTDEMERLQKELLAQKP